jgi:alkylhydroperoxidase family enzyme
MEEKRTAHQAVVTRILEGDGRASRTERRAAFDNTTLTEPLQGLITKVAKHPTQVTDDDIAGVKAAGLSEDQIFELVVCAAVGQATRQYSNALAALSVAVGAEGS